MWHATGTMCHNGALRLRMQLCQVPLQAAPGSHSKSCWPQHAHIQCAAHKRLSKLYLVGRLLSSRPADVQNLVPVRVEEVFGVVQQAQLRGAAVWRQQMRVSEWHGSMPASSCLHPDGAHGGIEHAGLAHRCTGKEAVSQRCPWLASRRRCQWRQPARWFRPLPATLVGPGRRLQNPSLALASGN